MELKLFLGKSDEIWPSDENFPRRRMFPDETFPRRNFPREGNGFSGIHYKS